MVMSERTLSHALIPEHEPLELRSRERVLRLWCTQDSLEDLAFGLTSELTLDGERLIVIDAQGCFDGSSFGESRIPQAVNQQVIPVHDTGELQKALWTVLQDAGRSSRPPRVLIVGVLERLCETDLLMRDAARALGRLKLAIGDMRHSGIDVTVACRRGVEDLGVRSYLFSSIRAAAEEIHMVPSAAQQDIDRTASAIA